MSLFHYKFYIFIAHNKALIVIIKINFVVTHCTMNPRYNESISSQRSCPC